MATNLLYREFIYLFFFSFGVVMIACMYVLAPEKVASLFLSKNVAVMTLLEDFPSVWNA